MNILQKFHITPANQSKIAWCLLFAIGINFAQGFIIVLPLSIFLQNHSPTLFPYIYIGTSLFSLVIGGIDNRFGQKINVIRLFSFLLPLIFLPLFALNLVSEGYWPTIVLLLWGQLIFRLTDLDLWGLMNRIFNLQEAKRFYGLIGGLSSISTIIAELLIPVFIQVVTESFLLMTACLLLVIFSASRKVFLKYSVSEEENSDEEAIETSSTAPKNSNSSYIYKLLLDTFLINAMFYFLDYAFNVSVKEQFDSEEKITNFLSIFFGVTTGVDVASRLGLMPYMISRFGVIPSMLLLPFSIGCCIFFAILFLPTFYLFPVFIFITLARLCDEGFRYSISDPTKLLMYQLLIPRTRAWIFSTSETIIEPMAALVSSFVLIFLSFYFPAPFIPVAITFILAILAIYNGFGIKKNYLHALKNSLKIRYFGPTLLPMDHDSLSLCEKYLKSPYPGAVIYSLQLLEKRGKKDFIHDLLNAIEHPSPLVKTYALQQLANYQSKQAADKVFALCKDGQQTLEIRAHALATLAAVSQTIEQKNYLKESLLSPYPIFRTTATIGMLKYPSLALEEEAKRQLAIITRSANDEDKLQAIKIFKALPHLTDPGFIEACLKDANHSIQNGAIGLVPFMSNRKTFFLFLSSLLDKNFAYEASRLALEEMGNEIVFPYLEYFSTFSTRTKINFIAIFRRAKISKERKTILHAFLTEKLHQYSLREDFAIWEFLLSYCDSALDKTDKIKIDLEIDYYCKSLGYLANLLEIILPTRNNFLITSIQGQADKVEQILFLLFSSEHLQEKMSRILTKLTHRNQQQQAYALELLYQLLDKEQRLKIIPLLSRYHELKNTQEGMSGPANQQVVVDSLREIVLNKYNLFSDVARAGALYALFQMHEKMDSKSIEVLNAENKVLFKEILIQY